MIKIRNLYVHRFHIAQITGEALTWIRPSRDLDAGYRMDDEGPKSRILHTFRARVCEDSIVIVRSPSESMLLRRAAVWCACGRSAACA